MTAHSDKSESSNTNNSGGSGELHVQLIDLPPLTKSRESRGQSWGRGFVEALAEQSSLSVSLKIDNRIKTALVRRVLVVIITLTKTD